MKPHLDGPFDAAMRYFTPDLYARFKDPQICNRLHGATVEGTGSRVKQKKEARST